VNEFTCVLVKEAKALSLVAYLFASVVNILGKRGLILPSLGIAKEFFAYLVISSCFKVILV
jgi:hypothetical protein